jgi:hypothetical protein
MSILARLRLRTQVAFRIWKEDGAVLLLRIVVRALLRPVNILVRTRPLAVLRLSWIAPTLMAVSSLAIAVALDARQPAGMAARFAAAIVGVALLVLAAGLALLNQGIWRSAARIWWRYLLRAIVLAAVVLIAGLIAPAQGFGTTLGFAIAAWLACSDLIEYLIDCLLWQKKHRSGPGAAPIDRLRLTDEQLRIVAVHEAGHLLMYGFLTRLPEDAFAMVDADPRYDFAGYVSAMRDISTVEMSTQLLAWHATLLYGGAAAEQVVYGRFSEGASADFDTAEQYLRRQVAIDPDLNYVRTAIIAEEHEANLRTIVALRVKLFSRAEQYIRANQQALLQVADHLAVKHSMDCEEFLSIWEQLHVPAGFERVATPSTVACLSTTSTRGM